MAEKSVNIRLSLRDGEVVKRALLSLGDDGQKALQRITNAAKPVSAGLKAVDASVRELKGGISNWAAEAGAGGRVLAAFGPAGLAAAAGVGLFFAAIKGAKKAADDFDAIADSAARLGVSIEGLQALRFAGSQLGVDIGDVDGALQKLGQSLGDVARGGNKEAAAAFERLGFSVTNADGTIKTIEEALPGLADGFANVGDAVTQLSLAQDIFGKGGAKFVTALTGGADALQQQIDKARELGAVVDESLVKKGAAAKDELDALSVVINSQLNSALIDLAPYLVAVAKGLADAAHFAGNLAQSFRDVEDQSTAHIQERIDTLKKALAVEEAISRTEIGKRLGGLPDWMAQRRADIAELEGLLSNRTSDQLADELEKRAQRRVAADAEREFQGQQDAKAKAQKEAEKAAADAQRELNRIMQEGQAVYKQTRTAAETYAETVAHLNELLKAGAINEDTRDRAVQQALETYQSAIEAQQRAADKLTKDIPTLKDAFTDMFDAAGSALEDFAATGKLNFEQLAADFRRMLAHMAVEYLKSALMRSLFPQTQSTILAPVAAIAPSIVGGPQPGLSSAFVPTLAKAIAPTAYTSSAIGPTAAGLIKQFEGYRSNAYWDVNAWRVGYGSDTMTTAAGDVSRVMKGSTTTIADATRDLTRRIAEFQQIVSGQIGPDAWAKLGPNSKASLTSVAYNYGSLPDNVAAAARTGDPTQIANAIRGLGSNPDRRIVEANNAMLDNARQMTQASDVMTENLTAIADGTSKAGREFGGKFTSGLSSLMQAISGSGGGMLNWFGSAFNGSFGGYLGPIGRLHGYYAKGDVFSRPTVFPMAHGWGLMAEAGPEGVLPLRRNRRGDLGVIFTGAGNDNRGGGGVVIHSTVVNNLGVEGTAETRQSQNPDGSYSMQTILNRRIDDRIGRMVPAINETGYGQQKRLKLR